MPANLQQPVTSFPAGTGQNDSVQTSNNKLYANDVALNASIAALETRTSTLEKGIAPVGGSPYGQVTDASLWNYSDLPAGTPGYGSVSLKASLAAAGVLDADGRAAYLWLTPTRIAVVTITGASNPLFQVLVYDIPASGVATLYASTTTGNTGSSAANVAVQGAWLASAGGASFRFLAQLNGNTGIAGGNWVTQAYTVTVNGDGTLSATGDVSFKMGTAVNGGFTPQTTGYQSRRRAYLTGTYTAFVPIRSFNTYDISAIYWGGYQPARAGGDTLVLEGGAHRAASGAMALDQMGVDLFLRVTDGYTALVNVAPGATVQAVISDDLAIGSPVKSVRLNNVAIQGNARLQCLSPSLAVVAFTASGSFATYAIKRDVSSGALTVPGSPSSSPPAGTVPFDTCQYSATKLVWFTKGAGLSAVAYTLSVNPDAASGVAAVTQAAVTPSFNLGTGAASAVAGDSYTPAFAAQSPSNPKRVVFFGRNTTRNSNVLDVVDFAA